MGEGTKVKFQLGSSTGIKAIIIVAVIAVAHQLYLEEFPEDEEMTLGTFTYGISCLAVGIAAIFVARRYWGSEIFGKTYLSLSIAFFLLAAGDFTYIYYDWYTDEAPYPSFADVFFFLFFPFAAFHLVKNIKYFKKDLKWGPKIAVPALVILIVGIFAYMSFDMIEEEPFDFYFGMLFVFTSAVIFALAILGAAVFRDSILGTSWLILAGGIFAFTVADVWYYYLEVVDGYTSYHYVNTLWVLGSAAIVYALYKHKKTI
ncbi:hypothetical protein MnTg01_00834 [archaeon MnTg01]|nr:hypothetical protein MnTg01_00834 [archaeon MnTg01]